MKWKISLMGFVYRVVWVLKALWIILSETINILRKLHKTKTFSACPRKCYHRVMYIAPSSGHVSLNCTMQFELILRRFEGFFFWCLEWECCTFGKIDGNSFKSTKMAVLVDLNEFQILLKSAAFFTPDIQKQPQTSLESL